jgi:dTDP-4-dehydrorhamnose 3,5-epimerase
MEVKKTEIPGCFIVERPFFKDERGYFSRAFDKEILEKYGMCADIMQSNLSENLKKYTLRGLHSQKAEYAEDKLIMCTRGKVFDVCVDVRKDSPTYKKYVGAELSEENGRCLYIPKGCAHGYLSLEDDTQTLYFVTHNYVPDSEECYSFDDPAFGIKWPVDDYSKLVISDKDRHHPYIGD